MPGKRATAVNLILLLLSVAVSLVLLEGLYRFYLFGWASLSVERMNSLHDLANSDLRRPSTQDGLVYELRPNLSTYYKLVPFETNSVGLRDGEYGTTKPRHVYRIAVVGDSYTVPSGVRVEDAYHTLLENRLNAGSRRTRYEVINFGVPGYALRQYREVIRSKVSAYDPDLVVVGFCARNDHLADLYRPTYRQQEVVDSFFESFVAKGIAHIRRGRRQDNDRVKRLRLSDKQKRYLADQVSAIGALSRDRGVPVLFVLLDIRPIRSPYLEAVLGANGLYFVNATLPFEGRRFRDYMQHPLDSHPNAAANAVFADVLYDYLISASLLGRSGPGPV